MHCCPHLGSGRPCAACSLWSRPGTSCTWAGSQEGRSRLSASCTHVAVASHVRALTYSPMPYGPKHAARALCYNPTPYVTSPPPMPQPHTATAPLPTLQPPAGTFLSTSVRPCTVSGECSSSSTASCLSVMAARSDRGRRNHSLNSLRPWAGEGGEGGRTVRGREAGASGEGQAYHVRHAALHVPKWTPPPHHVHDPRQNPPPLRPTMLVTQRCMTPNSEKPSLTLPMPMLDGCCSTWKICSARALNGSTCRKLVEGGGRWGTGGVCSAGLFYGEPPY